MDVQALGADFLTYDIISDYTSLIWTERYNEAGDFTMTLPYSEKYLNFVSSWEYLQIPDSKHLMMLEVREVDVSGDTPTIKFSGRSAEAILDRRIVLEHSGHLSGRPRGLMERAIHDCFTNPEDPQRTVPNFVLLTPTPESQFPASPTPYEMRWKSVYEVFTDLAKMFGFGFRITGNKVAGTIQLQAYYGVDRSGYYSGSQGNSLVLSAKNGSLDRTRHVISTADMKNLSYVGGETYESGLRRWNTGHAATGRPTGLNRREFFVDASDMSSKMDDETQLTEAEYMTSLRERGIAENAKRKRIEVMDGETGDTAPYLYGQHYNLGDIVLIESVYGYQKRVRVSEYTFSYSPTEKKSFPTLTAL